MWDSFHGQLDAQKYITAANVSSLAKAWEYHTGDLSDGSGDLPTSVWSATPIFANDTLYLWTPFYRVIALDPACPSSCDRVTPPPPPGPPIPEL